MTKVVTPKVDADLVLGETPTQALGPVMSDSLNKVPLSQIPASAITEVYVRNSQAQMLAIDAGVGDVCVRSDISKSYILQALPPATLANWIELLNPPAPVTSVDLQIGDVSLAGTYEPLIGAKGTAFNDNYGTGAGDVCQGNDGRLSDARTPLSHAHGSITNDGKVGSTANLPIKTGTAGAIEAGAFGTGATDFCVGNDARLSDARTPTSHAHGSITNDGKVGSTANLPVKTGTAGVVEAGAFGTGATDFCVGNDSRLSDARTPTSHAHGNVTNDGKVGSTANLPVKTGTAGVVEAGAFGTGATDFCVGNDSRLSDARTPTSHSHVPGDVTGTAVITNDARLSDARTPLSHTHGNVTNDGKVGSTANLPLKTGTAGAVEAGAFGTGATDFCVGNDARLSDARTPTSHAHGSVTNDGKIGTTATLPIITGTGGVLSAGAFGSSAGQFCQGNDARLSDGRTDANAIHKATASEISAITLKATPVSADMLLIEDSADSNNKKRITVGTLPGGVDSTAIHKATAAEISAMTEKTAPVDADLVVIEDSADSNNKKKVLVKNLAGKGCRHISAGACLGVSSSWNLANNFMFISITNGGQIIANDHISGDYRSGLTIRLRVKRTGTVNTPTITMYKNGVADATINASAITLTTSWASVSFTPGSTYAIDDDITFEINRGTGAGTLELQYIDVDWDRKVG